MFILVIILDTLYQFFLFNFSSERETTNILFYLSTKIIKKDYFIIDNSIFYPFKPKLFYLKISFLNESKDYIKIFKIVNLLVAHHSYQNIDAMAFVFLTIID